MFYTFTFLFVLQLAFNGLSFGIFDKEINKLAGIIINSVPEHYRMFGGFDEVEKKMSVQSKALLRVSSRT